MLINICKRFKFKAKVSEDWFLNISEVASDNVFYERNTL